MGSRSRFSCPTTRPLCDFVGRKGMNSFYQDGHRECCAIRKVAPLRRALRAYQGVDDGPASRPEPGHARSVARHRERCRAREREREAAQAQSAGGLVVRTGMGLYPQARRALQPAARRGLPLHRLPALHACDRTERARARWPLVVGARGCEGMRAPHGGRRNLGSTASVRPPTHHPLAETGRASFAFQWARNGLDAPHRRRRSSRR